MAQSTGSKQAGRERRGAGRAVASVSGAAVRDCAHPKIVNDLVGSLSDLGDQVVAISLLDSQDSNRYFGEIAVTPQLDPMEPSWPWIYSVDGEENPGGGQRP